MHEENKRNSLTDAIRTKKVKIVVTKKASKDIFGNSIGWKKDKF
jgi:hypothetical protein